MTIEEMTIEHKAIQDQVIQAIEVIPAERTRDTIEVSAAAV
jgi:hypothetical protein